MEMTLKAGGRGREGEGVLWIPEAAPVRALETGRSSRSVSDHRCYTPRSLIKHRLHSGHCLASTFPVVTLKASSQEQVNKIEKLQIFGLTSSHCHVPQNNIKVFHFWEEKAGEEHQTTEAVRTVKNWQLKV